MFVSQKAYLLWCILWIFGSIFLFLPVFRTYSRDTGLRSFGIAKGTAIMILFSFTWMLMIISKTFENILRASFLYCLLPSKAFYKIHAKLGVVIIILSLVHTIMHLGFNYTALSGMSLSSLNQLFVTLGTGYQFNLVPDYFFWLTSTPSITGFLLLIALGVMGIFGKGSMRKKSYERFQYTHILWALVIALMVLHGIMGYFGSPKAWKFLIVPAILLILEKLKLWFSYFSDKYHIENLTNLSGAGLIDLKVFKPENFKYIAGQYALLNIPEISKTQWHPFSFSSATYDDYIGFHIAPAGDWTNELKRIAQERAKTGDHLPRIHLLGPFGTPSQDFKKFKRLMIFATGVGATPFSSILKELLDCALNSSKNDQTEYSIDFYWVNRKPASYTWMSDLLMEIQECDPERKFLNVYMFFTSPQAKYDVRSFFLWTGLEILSQRSDTKIAQHFEYTYWGKPDWNNIFVNKTATLKKGRVGVFFCGHKSLATEIRELCIKNTGAVEYDFHMESF